MTTEVSLRTPAWLLVGLGNSPGVMELAEGRVAFTTEEGRVFEAPSGELRVDYPWYYFGGGCKISTAGATHKISFVRPNGAADVPGHLLGRADLGGATAGLALLTAGRKLLDVGQGRKAGKAWKQAFAAAAGAALQA